MNTRRIFQMLLSCCLLASCATYDRPYVAPNKTTQGTVIGITAGAAAGGAIGGTTGAPIGAVVGGVAGTLIGLDQQAKQTEEERLRLKLMHMGITVINMGDNYLLSIANRDLFYGNSPRIRWSSYQLLNLVADYLKQFNQLSIRVVGFTDTEHNKGRDFALSRARADYVASYLWSQGIDSRMIYAQGYGQKYPIASNRYLDGRAMNERIEIMFSHVRDDWV